MSLGTRLDVKQICEGVLTKAECFKALQTLKNGKSSGNDGFTAEFYQAFWPTLGHLLVDSLNSSFEKGELANSQKQGTFFSRPWKSSILESPLLSGYVFFILIYRAAL